ncbi:MAG: NADH-quinone oxidoreductase subunit J [Chloroflexi bacterium]|nr:NADH-quinone oxidoreductase subunit J [Chloroflexota bacterium]
MTVLQIIFLGISVIIVIGALMTVSSPNLVHAALWLILALAGVAAIFVLLEASFLAVVQVAVYIDAISILIVIAVMLTRRAMGETERQINRSWLLAAFAAFMVFSGILSLFSQVPQLANTPSDLVESSEFYIQELGKALVNVDQSIIPFEVASVLLLAAMIGAIFIARPPERAGGDS